MEDNHRAFTNVTKLVNKRANGWKVINRNRVMQVNFHICPQMTFDLLTPEYHRGQHRASTNEVWLQTSMLLESYKL